MSPTPKGSKKLVTDLDKDKSIGTPEKYKDIEIESDHEKSFVKNVDSKSGSLVDLNETERRSDLNDTSIAHSSTLKIPRNYHYNKMQESQHSRKTSKAKKRKLSKKSTKRSAMQ